MVKKYLLVAFVCLLFLGGVVIYQQKHFDDGKLHVTFCDVGQGDGIYIHTPAGKDIVVDGGPDASILSCLSSNMPFGDRTIDLMVLTHPHEDHYYGLKLIADRYQIKTFATEGLETVESNKLLTVLNRKKTSIRMLCQGDNVVFPEGVKLTTLWPKSCVNGVADKGLDLNTLSVAQLLSYGDFQLLLTGDINDLIDNQLTSMIGDIDVLKVPHHGSANGLDATFLDTVDPELAIISVGAKNRYGHPAPSIISLLASKSIKTLRTDKNGDIKLVSDGKTYWITK